MQRSKFRRRENSVVEEEGGRGQSEGERRSGEGVTVDDASSWFARQRDRTRLDSLHFPGSVSTLCPLTSGGFDVDRQCQLRDDIIME